MPLEILHFPLMLLRRRAAVEGAEIAPLAGPGIGLAGVEAVFAGFEFAGRGEGTREGGVGFPKFWCAVTGDSLYVTYLLDP